MTDRLRVTVVCFPNLGGSGVIAAEIAAGLAERGHRVRVVATAPPGRSLPQLDNLTFEPVRVSDYPLFKHPPYTLDVAAKLVELGADSDLLHIHYAVPHAASALLARQALGAGAPRCVATLHGTDVTLLADRPGYQAVARLSVAAADGLTTPSAFLREEARRLLALAPEMPIEVIPNFVDTRRFSPPTAAAHRRSEANQPATLLHVSNFRAVKRAADLIETLARVRRQLPARLLLVGDGPELAQAVQRAEQLGVAEHVVRLGERADVADLIASADGFLSTSANESFGVAALEALSCGVPVFGYRVGGLPEVVGDDCGVLVEPFDIDALADAVVASLRDHQRHDRYRRAARSRAVEHFDRDDILDRWESYYRELMSR